jgi:hypothetical protein
VQDERHREPPRTLLERVIDRVAQLRIVLAHADAVELEADALVAQDRQGTMLVGKAGQDLIVLGPPGDGSLPHGLGRGLLVAYE